MALLKHREHLPFIFSFIRALNGLNDVHPTTGRQYSLYRLPIQMLISPRNTLTHTLRNNVLPTVWASHSPVDLTHKINHYNVGV